MKGKINRENMQRFTWKKYCTTIVYNYVNVIFQDDLSSL